VLQAKHSHASRKIIYMRLRKMDIKLGVSLKTVLASAELAYLLQGDLLKTPLLSITRPI
jgi:hypothetical protein